MQRSLYISPDKCTGCLQCEMACSYENEGNFNPAKSRIKVFTFHSEGRFVPYTCTQCDEAWCKSACPTEAISWMPRPAPRWSMTVSVSAARFAPLPVPSARSTTTRRPARSSSVICAGAIRPVPRPVRRRLSPISMRRIPVTTRCVPGPRVLILKPPHRHRQGSR